MLTCSSSAETIPYIPPPIKRAKVLHSTPNHKPDSEKDLRMAVLNEQLKYWKRKNELLDEEFDNCTCKKKK